MKKGLKILIISLIGFLIFLTMTLLVFKYAEEIPAVKKDLYSYASELRSQFTDSEYEEAYLSYPPFVHPSDAWYINAELIYHAGGGIDGLCYTNSKEAIQTAIQHGNVIEIDFRYTKDNVLVCVHEWTDITQAGDALTLSEFESTKICGKYTPMTAKDLVDFMSQHEDVYIVVDTKENDSVQVIRDLIGISENRPDIIERFIIQLYAQDTKQSFLDLYPFPNENFLFTCYKYGSNYKGVLSICMEENIPVVTVSYGTWDADVIELFSAKNIILYEHTVNRPDYAQKSKNNGVYGFYTDFLTTS